MIITTFVPQHQWYRAGLFMSRLEGLRALILRKPYPGKRGAPHRLHRWITALTPFGDFEVPYGWLGCLTVTAFSTASLPTGTLWRRVRANSASGTAGHPIGAQALRAEVIALWSLRTQPS